MLLIYSSFYLPHKKKEKNCFILNLNEWNDLMNQNLKILIKHESIATHFNPIYTPKKKKKKQVILI